MNRLLLPLLALSPVVSAGDVAAVADAPPDAVRPGWTLVWNDEFSVDGAPDPAKWGYDLGFALRNHELQAYTDRRENARVEDGHLVIEARREHVVDPADPSRQAEYTSANLTTRGKADWTYGRIEARAQLCDARGTWPAIWMLGADIATAGWPRCGEIDIMEAVGFDPTGVFTTIHTELFNHLKGTQKGHRAELARAAAGFHVYACEWTADAIEFQIDDAPVFRFANDGGGPASWPFDHAQFLLIDLAVGGAWGGVKGVDDGAFPQRLLIDDVRVYRRDAQPK